MITVVKRDTFSRACCKVANDCTKNAVEFASDYNIALTHDEKTTATEIFLVIGHHRKWMTSPLKINYTKEDKFKQ